MPQLMESWCTVRSLVEKPRILARGRKRAIDRTVNPLREFYILDDWGSEKPGGFSSDGTPRDEVGTLVADGETYDVWKKTRVDKPAITGDSETFDQYFSIRRTARQCGTISVSEHFKQWEELGLSLGNFHEIKLLLESQFNSGTIKFTSASVTVN